MANIVEVIQAYKKYGPKSLVLNGLNMKVPRNTIYGLLGPSGCGKTTLLLSIVGFNHLDSGEVVLNGPKRKRDFGYMPQEISLFQDFTVEETCAFFGAVYGLEKTSCAKEARKLIALLQIPMGSTRLIKDLSGGQQRRVSLIVTLLHKPQILILDEPTVGLDCMLTVKIWDHLVNLTNQGTTVMITTHYIQETVRCHTVGMMRNGTLLTEGSPTALMESHGVDNLEDVFLRLCCMQTNNQEQPKKHPPPIRGRVNVFGEEKNFNKDRYLAYMYKQYCFFKRNIPQLVYVLLYPLVIALIFEMTAKDPSEIPIGLRSREKGADNCSHPVLTYYESLNCSLPPATCMLKKHLEALNPVTEYYDEEEAIDDLHDDKILGYVYLNENYTSNLVQRILITASHLGLSENDTFNIDLSNSIVIVDKSHYILTRFANTTMLKGHSAMFDELLTTCGIPTRTMKYPISFTAVYGEMDQPFRASALSGLLTGFCFYYPLLYTASTIMWEKTAGFVQRNTLAGVTYFEIVLTHLSWQYLIVVVQDLFGFFVLFKSFPLPSYPGNDFQILFLILMSNTAGIASGFLFTELCEVEIAVVYAVCFSMVAIFNLSGTIWPIEGAWGFMKTWANLGPGSCLHRSYPSTIFRGFGMDHYDLYFGVGVNMFWVAVFGIATASLYRYNRRNS
uniref:ABC transporter G family member 23 n=1 Tax=Lygus hesperus TaxID=30085 RepID=A0A0A9X7D7_LYGHE